MVVFGLALGAPLACVPGYEFKDTSTEDAGTDAAPAADARADAPQVAVDGGVDAPAPDMDAGLPVLVEAGTPGCFQISSPPDQGNAHIPIGQQFPYETDPPASGSHYPVWAAYQETATAIDYGYLVHNLEHGAIVLWYRCPANGNCDDIKNELRAASAAIPDDPVCVDAGMGVRVRTVIVPSKTMDVPIAAAGWDQLYKASCIDLPSLESFVKTHYRMGLEDICTNGQPF